MGLVFLALVLALIRLVCTAWTLQGLSGEENTYLLISQTYVGQIICAQTACLLLTLVCLLFITSIKPGVFFLFIAMLGSALSGHVAAAADHWSQTVVSVLHVVFAQLWLAGLISLGWQAKSSESTSDIWRLRLARFSKWALPAMSLILLSGILLSRWTVASWPGLLATPYGLLLMIKLMMVSGVLLCAFQLRRWLSTHPTSNAMARTWLTSEISLALAVLFMAGWLASTVPAAHETIFWPFTFRWAAVLAWQQDPVSTGQQLALGMMLGLIGLSLWLIWRQAYPRRAKWALIISVLTASVVTLAATSIPAYPSTYIHSPARLDTASVYAGQVLYEQHCLACHGLHARGDGPVARLNQLKPANLTEPHVNWHTHGDMFWWLSHGKGDMPGFADVLSIDERWHLINWLITLSMGYEARTLTPKPAPFNPWLPSIDFRFQMENNSFISLSEWRGLHAVHLVIVNQSAELKRAQELLTQMKGFPAQLVIVVKPEWSQVLDKGSCEAIIVADKNGDIAKAWSHYRRSFASPDFENQDQQVARTEFLIDRFGFVRARWRSDEMPTAAPVAELKVLYDSLSLEGEIKSAAIHQHD